MSFSVSHSLLSFLHWFSLCQIVSLSFRWSLWASVDRRLCCEVIREQSDRQGSYCSAARGTILVGNRHVKQLSAHTHTHTHVILLCFFLFLFCQCNTDKKVSETVKKTVKHTLDLLISRGLNISSIVIKDVLCLITSVFSLI